MSGGDGPEQGERGRLWDPSQPMPASIEWVLIMLAVVEECAHCLPNRSTHTALQSQVSMIIIIIIIKPVSLHVCLLLCVYVCVT